MEFKLPDIGEGVNEGELIRWLVKEGDVVAADQALLEVMTDKATVEVPAPNAGKISGLQGKEGQMIKVGQTLAQIDTSAAGAPAKAAPAPAAAPTPPVAAPAPQAAAPAPAAPAPAAKSQPAAGASRSEYVGAMEANSPSSIPAAPIVRAMAQRAGVDLASVQGSGAAVGGVNRVLEEDLVRFLNSKDSGGAMRSAPAAFNGNGLAQEVERKPLRGLRRVISNAMVKSKYTAPHYSYVDEFECSALVDIREEAKRLGEKMGVKISYLPFIVKAVVGALKEFPVVNSSLEDKADGSQEIVYKKFYHIGIAVATDDGLVVPVIKHADKKTLVEIAREMADLSNRARAGKLAADELKGSTFSITSMGNIGGLFATPIINYPEVGIMGVYKVQEKPLVQDGQIVIGKTMHLSLSLDHRVVDGAVGGLFCNAVIERLANPARLLMEMI
ncbi:MAG: 2-oxo acid dehydrogenase subunit E2 [Bdellovibrionales bacterium]|nr:2-oxo acid dehydrogenase subunit E2 [Bdellovibrionales bacterium]